MPEQENPLPIEEQKEQLEEKEVPSYELVISGMGPAALMAACMAARRGKTVLLVGNRYADFVRVQGIHLRSYNSSLLLSLLREELEQINDPYPEIHDGDKKFIEEIKANGTIAVKEVERFLWRRLAYLGSVSVLKNAQFIAADLETGQALIEVREPELEFPINFTYFIGADGARHHAATLIQDGERKALIEYEQRYTSHGHASAYFTVQGNQVVLPEKSFLVDYENNHLAMFSFNKRAAAQGKLKCGIAAELPVQLLPRDSKQLCPEEEHNIKQYLEARARKFLGAEDSKLHFEIEKSKKHGAAKDKMKFTIFSVSIHRAKQAVVCGKNSQRLFALLGDAFQGAHYQGGHGLNDALSCAVGLGSLLNSFPTATMLAEYHQYCLYLGNLAESNIKAILRVKKISSCSSLLASFLQKLSKTVFEDEASYVSAELAKEFSLIDRLLQPFPYYLFWPRKLDPETEAYLAAVKKELQVWKNKSEELKKRKEKASYGRANDLYKKMELYLQKLEWNLKHQKELELASEISHFQDQTLEAIKQANYVLESQRKPNAFFQNLALCVGTGIIPYGFFWGRKYLQTGKHLIRHETDSLKKLKESEKVIKKGPLF